MAEFLDNECTHYGCQLVASDGGRYQATYIPSVLNKQFITSGPPVMITASNDGLALPDYYVCTMNCSFYCILLQA